MSSEVRDLLAVAFTLAQAMDANMSAAHVHLRALGASLERNLHDTSQDNCDSESVSFANRPL
ncbi:hypothetical protein, partial [Klebsiella pneumoniae]|uniref:hypothetical protein n=1 Tax=Klebsiella pneumoniae TaxID=573 RepID=UPI003B97D43F